MTEESRHIQLTNQINFVPALCGPSNMNTTFTIFIQNSSLVDNHSTKYISVTLIWMIKYVQYVIIAWIISRPTWKVFTDITNYLTHMKNLKLMNHMGTGGLQSLKVNVRPSSLVLSCRRMHFFMTRRDSQLIMPPTWYVQVNVYLLERLCGSELIFYRTFTRKMITRPRTLKVNKPTVEWTF